MHKQIKLHTIHTSYLYENWLTEHLHYFIDEKPLFNIICENRFNYKNKQTYGVGFWLKKVNKG